MPSPGNYWIASSIRANCAFSSDGVYTNSIAVGFNTPYTTTLPSSFPGTLIDPDSTYDDYVLGN
ncbi:MAG: hypothetical protein KDA24_12260 [Deltaproteobacteria bacterium]|nr:hypothetical protein [Deltaproteobacteria bacterium]